MEETDQQHTASKHSNKGSKHFWIKLIVVATTSILVAVIGVWGDDILGWIRGPACKEVYAQNPAVVKYVDNTGYFDFDAPAAYHGDVLENSDTVDIAITTDNITSHNGAKLVLVDATLEPDKACTVDGPFVETVTLEELQSKNLYIHTGNNLHAIVDFVELSSDEDHVFKFDVNARRLEER